MAAAVAAPESPRVFDFRSPARTTDPMQQVCAGLQARAAQWRKDRTRAAHLELQRATKELHREHACIADLRAELSSATQLAEAAAKLREEGERLSEALHRSHDAAEQRVKELQREEQAMEGERRAADARDSEIDRFLGLYRERLGLAITHVGPQTVRLAFTLIDEDDPEREFSLDIGLSEAQAYRVSSCQPVQVQGLEELLARLNADTASPAALPAFVCGLRRAFREAAMSKAAVCACP